LTLLLLLAPQASFAEAATPAYGVLLLAHGGDPRWNSEVTALRGQIDAKVPTEVTFGMAFGQAQVREIQDGVNRLERRGVKKIVAVPLFVSSDSEVMDQVRFVFGIEKAPSKTLSDRMKAMGGHDHGYGHSIGEKPEDSGFNSYFNADDSKRVKTKVPLVLTPALDDHPLVTEILLEHAKGLSQEPKKETVILVGHGPVEDDKNRSWLEMMSRLGGTVQKKGGFKAVRAATLRDDAGAEVRDAAAKELRSMVQAAANGGGRAIVVPDLIAQGGIEPHIVRALEGLHYAWDGKTLMPHKSITEWALQRAEAGAKKDDMRKFK